MGCKIVLDSTIGIDGGAGVNYAFHLAVLEASLDLMTKLVSENQLEAIADSFYRNETPIALQDAYEALAALKLALTEMQQEAG